MLCDVLCVAIQKTGERTDCLLGQICDQSCLLKKGGSQKNSHRNARITADCGSQLRDANALAMPGPDPQLTRRTKAGSSPWSSDTAAFSNAEVDHVLVEKYCPVNPAPCLPASLHPPLDEPLPPVIYHMHAPLGLSTPRLIADLITEHTSLTHGLVRELVAFGAIYLRAGVPDPHTSPRPVRLTPDTAMRPLPPAAPLYIRVYASPKRHVALFPIVILHDGDGLVVVNKPPGVPVAESVDNIFENARRMAAAAVGADTLYVTSRLDIGTSGVLLFARTAAIAGAANRALQKSRKTYEVLTRERPETGTLLHQYNKRASHSQGLMKAPLLRVPPCEMSNSSCPAGISEPTANWVHAELKIEKVTAIAASTAWESQVHLVTGRTHQIRLQFAAKGWNVWGDCKYSEISGHEGGLTEGYLGQDVKKLGLHAAKLEIEWRGENRTFHAGKAWWQRES